MFEDKLEVLGTSIVEETRRSGTGDGGRGPSRGRRDTDVGTSERMIRTTSDPNRYTALRTLDPFQPRRAVTLLLRRDPDRVPDRTASERYISKFKS